MTLKRTLQKNRRHFNGHFTKIGDLETDPKIKNHIVILFVYRETIEFFYKIAFFHKKITKIKTFPQIYK